MRNLEKISQAVDDASDAGDEALLRQLCKECEDRMTTARGEERVRLRFYQANTYAGIIGCNRQNSSFAWSWEQPDGVQEILSLRKAILEPSFGTLNPVYGCQIRTNLANRLNDLGRPIAANEQWLMVLKIVPNFAKSLANRAQGLASYAGAIYDDGHKHLLLAAARSTFDEALDANALWESDDRISHAPRLIEQRGEIVRYFKRIGYDEILDLNQWPLGSTKQERRYRSWCLRERLFLNPLNDAYTDSVAATDVLHLADHVYAIRDAPRFPAYYNLLKQEYIGARYRLYRAIHERDPAFIMRDAQMLDSGEADILGHFTEELRSSFRSSYALFDKVGLLLNDYFEVGLRAGNVSFRGLWRKDQDKPEVRDVFRGRKNWPLRGLYFLSRDLFEEGFRDVAEPDAFNLADLRRRVEHRFVSFQDSATEESSETHMCISLGEFEPKALRLLKLAREALVYVSLAIHREERVRQESADIKSAPRGVFKPRHVKSFRRM